VVASCIIFVLQVILALCFLYYAYIYSNLHTIQCKANAYSLTPLSSTTNSKGIDVTANFRIAIRSGFWICVINLVRSILSHAAKWLNQPILLYTSYVIHAFNLCLVLMLFIFLQIWRWGQAGMVCSGEYLRAGASPEVKAGYLIEEGIFLKWVLITTYIIMSITVTTVCCLALFFYQKKSAEEVFTQKNLFSEKV
jgi:hypothetical protein